MKSVPIAIVMALLSLEAQAGISILGSYDNNGEDGVYSSGAQSYTDVTVPSGTTIAIVTIASYDTFWGSNISGVSLSGTAALGAAPIIRQTGDPSYNGVEIWAVVSPTSGSGKTLAWTNGEELDSGPSIGIVFLGGSETADPIRDSDEAHTDSATNTTPSMDSVAGDVAVSVMASDDANADPTGDGATHYLDDVEVAGAAYTNHGDVAYKVASGSTITMTVTGSYPSIAAVVVKAAAAGGASIPAILQQTGDM